MEEKKLTDEEIVKSLEYCANSGNCERGKCLFTKHEEHGRKNFCFGYGSELALDLIHRLQDDYSKLKERYIKVLDLNEKVIAEQKAEIERLKKGQAESAKTAVEVLEQNIELQKQVEYWESETKIARRDIDEAVKDTAKEIYLRVKNKSGAELSFLNDLALWIKERVGVAVEKWISKLN